MAIQINGNGTITGISVGGLPNGIVDTDMLAANAVTPAKSTITGGKILQYKTAKRVSASETSSTGYSEVHSDLRITLTPIASDSIIHVLAYIYCTNHDDRYTTFRMRRNTASDFSGTSTEVLSGSSEDGNDDGVCTVYASGINVVAPVVVYETSGNTTARTYSPFYRVNAGTAYVNRRYGYEYFGLSTMTVMEVAA